MDLGTYILKYSLFYVASAIQPIPVPENDRQTDQRTPTSFDRGYICIPYQAGCAMLVAI